MAEVSEPYIDPLLGTTVGTYAIEERIGEGGMAVVYRARTPSSPRPVALKVFQRSWAQDPRVVRRFVREARIASALTNPNTVKIHDFGEDDAGVLYIAMELLEGRSLREYVAENGKVPPPLAAEIAAQVCRSLVDAHEHGIVHRDLKPDNVHLTAGAGGALVCKVLDYGVARVVSTDAAVPAYTVLTQIGTIVGTPAYMSPEQARAEEIDARTDLYALGVMLFEMLQGFLPFFDKNPIRLLEKQKNDPPPVLLDAPALLGELVGRLLAKSPDDRPSSASQVLTVLEAYLAMTSPLDRRLSEGDVRVDARGDGTDRITTGVGAKDEVETVPAVRRGTTPRPDGVPAHHPPAPVDASAPPSLPVPLTRAQKPGPPGLSTPPLLDVPRTSSVARSRSPSRTGPAAAALILVLGVAASIAIVWNQRSRPTPRAVPATMDFSAEEAAHAEGPSAEDRGLSASAENRDQSASANPSAEDRGPSASPSASAEDRGQSASPSPSPSPSGEARGPSPSPSPSAEDRQPSTGSEDGPPALPSPESLGEWSGSFRTQEGWMRLTQTADRVTGLFGAGGRMGRLWGRIEGGAIEFRWVIRATDDGEDEQGRGRVRRTTGEDGSPRLSASLGTGDAVTGYASWTLRAAPP